MSRKRKISLREFDSRNCTDTEERRFFIGDNMNEVRLKGISDFDVFPACETVVSDSLGCVVSKDDAVNIDDLNVYNSDSLFINSDSCNYEYVLTENDLLNSVPENTNFYNESITLYNSNCENEISFDSSFEQECSDNFESAVTSNPQVFSKIDVATNNPYTEIVSVAENLENIVPNLHLNTSVNSDIDCNNFSNENEASELQYEHNKTGNAGSVSTDEPEVSSCLNKTSVNTYESEDGMLGEFLYFKEAQINNNLISNNKFDNNVNNNNDVNNTLLNSLVSILGPSNNYKNVKILPLRYLKQSGILSKKTPQQIKSDLLSPSKVSNLQRIVDVKNVGSLKLNIKQPQLSSNDLKKIMSGIKNKNISSIKYKDLVKSQNTKKEVDIFDKSKSHTSCIDKGVQTINKCIFYSNINETDELKKIKITKKNEYTFLDRIKKPEPFNKLLLFTFAVNIRSSLCTVLTQEDFINNNEKISYYTGVPQYSYFMALLNILNLPNNNTISPFQMLLLTLMKIRLNLDWVDLAYRFGRSVQVAKDTFGITVYILTRCLSSLVSWPLQDECVFRSGKNLYVYGIELSSEHSNCVEYGNRIFICLSNSGHPIHFVSKPISEEYSNRIDILENSGIINGLVQNDAIIFDKNTNYTSKNEEWSTVLTVLSKSRDSFCAQPYSESMEKDIEKMKKIVNEIRKYKFLFDSVTCEWVNIPHNEITLFTDVVKVVCGLINLCDILPFSNCTVKKIISERRNMKIMLT